MVIAVDAFGGDNAPDEVIKGAAEAVKEYGVEVILTGDEKVINERIGALGINRQGISVENADGIIRIEDNPLDIRKAKAGSSMDCSQWTLFTLSFSSLWISVNCFSSGKPTIPLENVMIFSSSITTSPKFLVVIFIASSFLPVGRFFISN